MLYGYANESYVRCDRYGFGKMSRLDEAVRLPHVGISCREMDSAGQSCPARREAWDGDELDGEEPGQRRRFCAFDSSFGLNNYGRHRLGQLVVDLLGDAGGAWQI